MPNTDRKLRVFLCHSSQDKPIVRELYQRLLAEGWIDPWLDEEKLLPGQDWSMEIERAVESADAVIVCLSNNSVSKEGYVQRELRFVLDIALEKSDETIFIIPLRLDDIQPPRRLLPLQYIDYFPLKRRKWAFQRLQQALKIRQEQKSQNHQKISTNLHTQNIIENPNTGYASERKRNISHLQITKLGLLIGVLYIPFYILFGAMVDLLLEDFLKIITYQDVTAYLVPLGIARGSLASYILLKNRTELPRKDRVKIGVEIGIASSLPFILIVIISYLLALTSHNIFYAIEITLTPDVILGLLGAWLIAYFLPQPMRRKI